MQPPAHASGMRPLKHAVRLITDRAHGSDFKVGLENIESWTGRRLIAESDFEGEGVAFRTGDVLYGKLRPYLAKAWVADRPGAAVGDFFVLRPYDGIDPSFIRASLLSVAAIDQISASVYGSKMPRANWDAVGALLLPDLTWPDQIAICDYLDRETAEIDAFIADQEELIALLTERRAATISHAVTKGLDPSAPMKESGVEWLGQVPAAWGVRRLKDIGTSLIGLTYEPHDVVDPAAPQARIVLRSGNIQRGQLTLEDVVAVDKAIPTSLITRPDDLLVCARNGSRDLVGKNAMVGTVGAGQTFGAFMTVVRSREVRYLRWVLNSSLFASQMGLFSTSTVNQLTKSTLNTFSFPWPSRSQREQICLHLDREAAEIDAAIGDGREAIALSRERRTALITGAVTGHIDVTASRQPRQPAAAFA